MRVVIYKNLPFIGIMIITGESTIVDLTNHNKTDSFNYLHSSSNHPSHWKRNIPFSLARPLRGKVLKKDDRIKYLKLKNTSSLKTS